MDRFSGMTMQRGPASDPETYYQPPNTWYRIGLNVLGKYDNGNNDWLSMNNIPGEWYVAYHGIRAPNMHQVAGSIINQGLQPGQYQACQNYICSKT